MNKLTKANNTFSAILNSGGFSGSYLHLLGVPEMIDQHFLTSPVSNTRETLLGRPELLAGTSSLDLGSVTSPRASFSGGSECGGVESGGATITSTTSSWSAILGEGNDNAEEHEQMKPRGKRR